MNMKENMKSTNFQKVISFTKHPAKVALAITKDVKGKVNLMTMEWFMRTSIKPPMLAISVGHTRYSHECLQNFRYFNLCIPSKDMVEEVKLCGTQSGRDIDKLKVTKLDWFKGRLCQLPILRDAVANFECEITTQIRSGDHTIYVGEVKYSWLNEDKKILTYKDLK